LTNNANFDNSGTVNAGLANNGTVVASGGTTTGAIANNAGAFDVAGTFVSGSVFANADGATLAIEGMGNSP
jgi:hypothetical protein